MRIVTALVGIPLFLLLTWLGGWAFVGLVVAVAVAGQWELYGLFRRAGVDAGGLLPLLAGAAVVVAPLAPQALYVAVAVALVSLGRYAFVPAEGSVLSRAAGTGLGLLYPALLLVPLVAIRLLDGVDAFRVTMAVFVLMWTADTAAYYAGRTFGKHPLAPTVSPKKTWEGFFGGLAGALVVAAAVGLWADTGVEWPHWIALGALTAVVGPVGDLFESALKRAAGVKDSSSLLPGHGGVLDRFDALVFVAPVVWMYLRLTGFA